MTRPQPAESVLIRGPGGMIEVLIDTPAVIRGIALVCHPHPLYGGSNTNKVAHTIARAYCEKGYVVLRPNFRGVGQSEGMHDEGRAEQEDMLFVLTWAQSRWGALPVALGGFSFGAFVQLGIVNELAKDVHLPRQLVLVGLAAGRVSEGARQYVTPRVVAEVPTLIVHGEDDETVPLANVMDWARPQGQPIVVVPGAGHFFHGRLQVIRDLMQVNVSPVNS